MTVERHVILPLPDRLLEEMDSARRQLVIDGADVEPTPQEAKNGWTRATLTAYLRERLAAQGLWVDPASLKRRARPRAQNMTYDPHRWREG